MFRFYVCDTAQDLLYAVAQLPDSATVLYQTPDHSPESGSLVQHLVTGYDPATHRSTISGARNPLNYANKFILIVQT